MQFLLKDAAVASSAKAGCAIRTQSPAAQADSTCPRLSGGQLLCFPRALMVQFTLKTGSVCVGLPAGELAATLMGLLGRFVHPSKCADLIVALLQ